MTNKIAKRILCTLIAIVVSHWLAFVLDYAVFAYCSLLLDQQVSVLTQKQSGMLCIISLGWTAILATFGPPLTIDFDRSY